MTDVCLPFRINFDCLAACAIGIKRFVKDPTILLHIHEKGEDDRAMAILAEAGLPARIVSRGEQPRGICEIFEVMLRAATDDCVVFLEQDVFLVRPIDELCKLVLDGHFDLLGPLDSQFIDRRIHPNLRLYGQFNRFPLKPSYMHTSLLTMNRNRVLEVGGDKPFCIPPKVRLYGYGVLGAELYYGLCYNFHQKNLAQRLGFMRQVQGDYGYSAQLWYDSKLWAHHLFFSSTRWGYAEQGSFSREEVDWLGQQEAAFLRDYRAMLAMPDSSASPLVTGLPHRMY